MLTMIKLLQFIGQYIHPLLVILSIMRISFRYVFVWGFELNAKNILQNFEGNLLLVHVFGERFYIRPVHTPLETRIIHLSVLIDVKLAKGHQESKAGTLLGILIPYPLKITRICTSKGKKRCQNQVNFFFS